jgi:hypothetical protein
MQQGKQLPVAAFAFIPSPQSGASRMPCKRVITHALNAQAALADAKK